MLGKEHGNLGEIKGLRQAKKERKRERAVGKLRKKISNVANILRKKSRTCGPNQKEARLQVHVIIH